MENELKLFVWEKVLVDYTDGIMFALAKDVDQARNIIRKRAREYYIDDDLEKEPEVYTDPVGFFIFGGDNESKSQ